MSSPADALLERTGSGAAPGARGARGSVRGWHPWDLGILLALFGVGASVLVPVLLVGLPASGAFSLYAEDQLQYFAWIREAAHHVLAGDRYDLAPGARTFLHPVFVLSAAVHRATGLPIPLAYLLWTPVAVVLLLAGFRRYVQRLLPRDGERAAALVLALFTVSPLYMAARVAGLMSRESAAAAADVAREAWVAGYLWGYLSSAITVALMPLVLLGCESWLDRRSQRTLWMTSAAALLVSWLHPWQGATLGIIVVAVEALRFRDARRAPPTGLLVVLVALALPAVYYLLLSRLDPVWQTYDRQNTFAGRPWLATVLAVLPLAAPAVLAYRLPAAGWQERAVRVWPLAALLVYVLPLGAYPLHALNGVTLPLAILAVQGVAPVWPRRRAAVAAAAAVLFLAVPGTAHALRVVWWKANSGEHGYFVRRDEQHALAALERDPRPGGILSPVSSGALVPFLTGREVYVGHDSWSPDFATRARLAEELFAGRLPDDSARAFVRSTRARFLYADCRHPADLQAALRPLLAGVTSYGCATVYELAPRPEMTEAAGPPDR